MYKTPFVLCLTSLYLLLFWATFCFTVIIQEGAYSGYVGGANVALRTMNSGKENQKSVNNQNSLATRFCSTVVIKETNKLSGHNGVVDCQAIMD